MSPVEKRCPPPAAKGVHQQEAPGKDTATDTQGKDGRESKAKLRKGQLVVSRGTTGEARERRKWGGQTHKGGEQRINHQTNTLKVTLRWAEAPGGDTEGRG